MTIASQFQSGVERFGSRVPATQPPILVGPLPASQVEPRKRQTALTRLAEQGVTEIAVHTAEQDVHQTLTELVEVTGKLKQEQFAIRAIDLINKLPSTFGHVSRDAALGIIRGLASGAIPIKS